jgi:hypothetical protein
VVPPGPEEETMKKIVLSSIAAVAFVLSASTAFADAGDRDFSDNPILAEQYFYSHRSQQDASAEQARPPRMMRAAQTHHKRPHFTTLAHRPGQ